MSRLPTVLYLALSLLILLSCAVPPFAGPSPTPLPVLDLPPDPAPNFAFTFSYGSCTPRFRVLDTFANTLTQNPTGAPSATIPFTLTPTQRRDIYRHMVDINLWSYPTPFEVWVPPGEIGSGSHIFPVYQFRVQNGDRVKTIAWEDNITSHQSYEADQLRILIMSLKHMIEFHPDFQQLPPMGDACA